MKKSKENNRKPLEMDPRICDFLHNFLYISLKNDNPNKYSKWINMNFEIINMKTTKFIKRNLFKFADWNKTLGKKTYT